MDKDQRIAELEATLLVVSEMNETFHAVKNIRAWAAEENVEIKAAIRNTIASVVTA